MVMLTEKAFAQNRMDMFSTTRTVMTMTMTFILSVRNYAMVKMMIVMEFLMKNIDHVLSGYRWGWIWNNW